MIPKRKDEGNFIRPSKAVLRGVARLLLDAEHRQVAGHLAAGLLWAAYPEWYDVNLRHNNTNEQFETTRKHC